DHLVFAEHVERDQEQDRPAALAGSARQLPGAGSCSRSHTVVSIVGLLVVYPGVREYSQSNTASVACLRKDHAAPQPPTITSRSAPRRRVGNRWAGASSSAPTARGMCRTRAAPCRCVYSALPLGST